MVLYASCFFGEGGELYLLHEVTDLLDLFLELRGLLFCLLFERCDLVVGLVPVLVCIVGLLNYIRHLLALFMQLTLQLLVEIIEDNSFFPETVNDQFQFLIDSDGLIEFLIGLIQSILQDFDLFLKIGFAFCSRVDPKAILFLLYDLLLEIADMDIDIFLCLLLFLNGIGYFAEKLLHVFKVMTVLAFAILLVVDFSLGYN